MAIEATVSFYGVIRDLVSSRRVEVRLPDGSTVRDLLETLGERHGPRFRSRVLAADGGPQKSVKVVVGGKTIDAEGLDRALGGEGSLQVQVLIIPPVFGGYSS